MLNRREFMIATALSALLAPGRATAALADQPGEQVFLNRLTFGATPADREALATMGRAAWLDAQFALPAREPSIEARLSNLQLRIAYDAGYDEVGSWEAVDELRPLASLHADPATLLPLLDWERPLEWSERVRPADEVIHAVLTRAVHAPAQVREVMTQFWHDHFNVNSAKDAESAVYFPQHDAALREHALGNFRQLLQAVAQSPAMLYYLNNSESRASPANENYARELLELHTLGAPHYINQLYDRWGEVPLDENGIATGYIDEDVYEVARAFTGWSIGDGRWIAEGVEAPRTGQFYFIESWHDPYQKRILGVEFPPNRGPMEDGMQVMDILAHHPGTARYVCGKIARRLLSDEPDPALVDRLAQVFLDQAEAPDQIAQVVRTLALDPAFDAPPEKVRRPFEYLAALYRASGAKVGGTEIGYHWQLSRAGWLQHTMPPPTGHSDKNEDWQTGTVLLRMVDYAVSAHDDWFGCTQSRLSGMVGGDVRTFGDLSALIANRCHGTSDDVLAELWEGFGVSPSDPLPEAETDRHDTVAVAFAFAALTPQFLYR
jgi:uncharacterized protein (DUF1800 family)